jgi:hypothetical protein
MRKSGWPTEETAMRRAMLSSNTSRRLIAVAFGLLVGPALAADLPSRAPSVVQPTEVANAWSFRFLPYGWLTSIKGTQTVRGRSAKVDASFIDIVEKSDHLVALMGDFEARNGRFSLYGDLVWSKIGVEGGNVRTRSPAPGIAGSVGRTLSLDFQMAIIELGATYEVARCGPVAFDLLGGVRYWHQEAELGLDVTRTLDIGNLQIAGSRAFARSGSVDWLDPLIGARVRYAVAPGHELFLRGDIGGFGAGSDFSWQAIAAYGFDFGIYNGITFSGVIGYRALSVDYSKGSARTRYEFDTLQHGPVLGLSMRF